MDQCQTPNFVSYLKLRYDINDTAPIAGLLYVAAINDVCLRIIVDKSVVIYDTQ